nr:MAG: 50S ribosomal protein L34 [Thermoproteus sp. AZ2]
MPRPSLRSRALRRIQRRTPGGRTATRYEKRFAGPPRCAITGAPLQGMDAKRVKAEHGPIRPPSRPYGGYAAHWVLARALRAAARS